MNKTHIYQNCYLYEHPSVYIVLEHSYGVVDAKIHGVYSTRKIALGKKEKLAKKGANGYLCVLKKPIEGPSINPTTVYVLDR